MFKCRMKFKGIGDLMRGRYVDDPKRDDESHDQREQRTWPNKVAITADGQCYIPPFALKNARSAGKWLDVKLKGKSTYTKRLVAGTQVFDKMLLTDHKGQPLTIKDIDPVVLFVPSNGRSGDAGTRVPRTFPTLHEWATEATLQVFDNVLTEDMVRRHVVAIGQFVGFGSMRVENGGINGRFSVEEFEWSEIQL